MYIMAIYSKTTEELTVNYNENFTKLVFSTIAMLEDVRLSATLAKAGAQKVLNTETLINVLKYYDYVVEVKKIKE